MGVWLVCSKRSPTGAADRGLQLVSAGVEVPFVSVANSTAIRVMLSISLAGGHTTNLSTQQSQHLKAFLLVEIGSYSSHSQSRLGKVSYAHKFYIKVSVILHKSTTFHRIQHQPTNTSKLGMSRQQSLNPVTAYSLAHTAQCKLKLAANRPDRNLRFVLGHAFTLDNVMLRIVEIENQGAKSAYGEGTKSPTDVEDEHYDCTAPKPVEHYDCTKQAPPDEPTAPVSAQPEPVARGRRISFQDNNARPSSTAGVASNNQTTSPARKRSPPPVSVTSALIDDDDEDGEGTSSDDYDEPGSYAYTTNTDDSSVPAAAASESSPKGSKKRPLRDAYLDEEDAALELADDELDDPLDDMAGLSLTRFESAAAQPPRMIRDESDDEDDDEDSGPVSPPQLPLEVDVREIVGGDKDDELAGLFDSVRRCACHGQRDNLGEPEGVWDVPVEKTGGRRLAVVALGA